MFRTERQLHVGRFPSGQREQTVNLPSPTSMVRIHPCPPSSAGMAELADALDSGSSESNFMQVQVLFPAPPRDSDIDTISGSFLLRFFGSAMQNLRDFALELAFGGGELQDFVSLNRMLNLLPNG